MRHTQGLQRAAIQEGQTIATVYRGRKRTYREILERVSRFAAALGALGAKPGDRIAVIAANSDRYYEAYYAILWAGCVVVPGNTRWAPAEHAYALRDSEPSLLLVDRAFEKLGVELAGERSIPVVLLDDAEPGGDLPAQDALIEAPPEPRRSDVRRLHDVVRETVPELEPTTVARMLGYGRYGYRYAGG